MRMFIFLILFFSQFTWANTGTDKNIYRELKDFELDGWKQVETSSTIKLESACGVEAELYLVGNHRHNRLLMGITNGNQSPVIIRNSDIKFIFDGKKERFPGYQFGNLDHRVLEGWWSIQQVNFPKKKDFKDVKELEVIIPVYNEKDRSTCSLTARFLKHKEIKSESFSYSAIEFAIDVGGELGQSGNFKKLGDPSGYVGFEMNFFIRPEWGLGMVYASEHNFKNTPSSKIFNRFRRGDDYEARVTYLGFQYLRRFYLSDNFTIQYALGPGFQTIENSTDTYNGDIEGSSLALSQKLIFNWRYHQVYLPSRETLDLILGAGVIHHYTPGLKIAGVNLDGHRSNWIVRVGFQF